MTLAIQIFACILMLIDTIQTYRMLKIDIQAEGNPVIRFIFKHTGMSGMISFKVLISLGPFIMGNGAIILLIVYSYVVYYNYIGFKEYETDNSIH